MAGIRAITRTMRVPRATDRDKRHAVALRDETVLLHFCARGACRRCTKAAGRFPSSSPFSSHKDAEGQIEWVAALVRDVTQRYIREKALRARLKASGHDR